MKAATAKIGIVRDFAEENWPSMELVPDMLARFLAEESPDFAVIQFAPRMTKWFRCLPWCERTHYAFMADRLANRLYRYPRWLHSTLSAGNEIDRRTRCPSGG